jgi:hypothetical protein
MFDQEAAVFGPMAGKGRLAPKQGADIRIDEVLRRCTIMLDQVQRAVRGGDDRRIREVLNHAQALLDDLRARR